MIARGALALALAALVAATPVEAETPGAAAPPPLALEFIDTAIAEGRTQAAEQQLARLRGFARHPEVALRAAELLLAAGALEAAGAGFAALEAEPAVAARALTGRALALVRSGREAEAEPLVARAVAADPGLARAWTLGGALADRRGDSAVARHRHDRAVAADPASADARNNRGWSRILEGRAADAEADLLEAVRLDPRLTAARTNLALARALQGRYAEAFAGADRSSIARLLNVAGVGAMVRGDRGLAESYFARALDADGRFNAAAAANLAWLQQQGRAP